MSEEDETEFMGVVKVEAKAVTTATATTAATATESEIPSAKHPARESSTAASASHNPNHFSPTYTNLLKLESYQTHRLKYPVGCPVWYDFHSNSCSSRSSKAVVSTGVVSVASASP